MTAKMISLRQWAKDTYGDAAPSIGTLRRWARQGRVVAEKHGREYFVSSDAHYAANDSEKSGNVRSVRLCVEPEDKASNLLEQMIRGRKKKAT